MLVGFSRGSISRLCSTRRERVRQGRSLTSHAVNALLHWAERLWARRLWARHAHSSWPKRPPSVRTVTQWAQAGVDSPHEYIADDSAADPSDGAVYNRRPSGTLLTALQGGQLRQHTAQSEDVLPSTSRTLTERRLQSLGRLSDKKGTGLSAELAPHDDVEIKPGDKLVVVAETFALANKARSHQHTAALMPAAAKPANSRALTSAVEEATQVDSGRNVYLLVGWPTSIGPLLTALDQRVAAGSEAVILSEKSISWREIELQKRGLAVDGRPFGKEVVEDEEEGGRGDGRGGEGTPLLDSNRGGSSTNRSTEGLQHLTLKHLVGYTTDEAAIRHLPLERAVAAIISADVAGTEDVDSQITDSEVINTVHLLRTIYEPLVAADHSQHMAAHGSPRLPLNLAVRFDDVLTRRLLEAQPTLLDPWCDRPRPWELDGHMGGQALGQPLAKLVDVVVLHRAYLEASALAVSTQSQASWALLQRLFDVGDGADLRAFSVDTLLEAHELHRVEAYAHNPAHDPAHGEARSEAAPVEFNFHELAKRVSDGGRGVLLGWQRLDENHAIQINPHDQLVRRPWSSNDVLLVVVQTSKRYSAEDDLRA